MWQARATLALIAVASKVNRELEVAVALVASWILTYAVATPGSQAIPIRVGAKIRMAFVAAVRIVLIAKFTIHRMIPPCRHKFKSTRPFATAARAWTLPLIGLRVGTPARQVF